jgi:hypothetical protein
MTASINLTLPEGYLRNGRQEFTTADNSIRTFADDLPDLCRIDEKSSHCVTESMQMHPDLDRHHDVLQTGPDSSSWQGIKDIKALDIDLVGVGSQFNNQSLHRTLETSIARV